MPVRQRGHPLRWDAALEPTASPDASSKTSTAREAAAWAQTELVQPQEGGEAYVFRIPRACSSSCRLCCTLE